MNNGNEQLKERVARLENELRAALQNVRQELANAIIANRNVLMKHITQLFADLAQVQEELRNVERHVGFKQPPPPPLLPMPPHVGG